MRKSILILSSFLLLAGCVGEENLDYDKTWNEDLDYVVDTDGDVTITVPTEEELTDTIDLRIFDAINLDYPGLEKVKEAYLAGKLYEESQAAEEGGETEGGETGGTTDENGGAEASKATDTAGDAAGDKDGYYKAAWYLLDYFRNRTDVKFPQIELDMINASYTANEKTIADKADEGHFYVRNFVYYADEKKTIYSDFADFNNPAYDPDKETGEGETAPAKYLWGMANPGDLPGSGTSEFKSQQHRHQWMITEAKVFRATGDTAYINNWKSVYRDWVDHCPAPENAETANVVGGSDTEWYGLQPAERLIDQCSIFYYYLDSENFTPGYLTFFLSEFAKTANIIKANPYMPKENDTELVHNITLAQFRSLYFAGILFPEFVKAPEWEQTSTDKIEEMSGNIFLSDGGPAERDPGYHMGNISGMYDVYLLANGNGRILPFDISVMEKGCEFIADLIYPNYSIDNFNDTRSSSYTKNVLKNNNLGKYRELFPENNKIRFMSSEGKDGSTPGDMVQTYPETGYYMLRTGWTAEDAMMVIKNNPEGGWHCQYDNLTFTIYSNGISFSPDAGCYTYDDSDPNRATYAASGMHNVMIKPNGKISNGVDFDKESRSGEFLGSGSGRNYEWVSGQNDNYPDLTHRRTAFVVDNEFFVLVDEGFGTYSGQMKLLFKGGNPDGKKRDNFIIENSIKEKETGSIDTGLPVTMYTNMSGNSNMMFVTFPETKDGYDSQWTTGYFSNKTGESTNRRVYEVSQNKADGKAVRFISVIYPYGSAAEYENIKVTSAEFVSKDFSETGATVRVVITKDGTPVTYNLTYTL